MESISLHPTSDVQTYKIGHGTTIEAFTLIKEDVIIGNNCIIESHCIIEKGVKIGNNVTIKGGTYIDEGIKIEDNVIIGPKVLITNQFHPVQGRVNQVLDHTVIRKNASIGAGTIIKGVILIDTNVKIDSGALLTINTSQDGFYAGYPAKQGGRACQCGEVIPHGSICDKCRRFI